MNHLMKAWLVVASIERCLSWNSFQELAKHSLADNVRVQLNLPDNEAIRSVKLALMYSLVTPFNNLVAAILAENATTETEVSISVDRKSYLYFDKMWTLSELADDARVHTICEVGFQSGHTALNFLVANPHARFISFDIFDSRHGPAAVRALHEMFLNREVIVVAGSSLRSIKSMTNTLKEQCNLIYIDGSRTPYGLLHEIEALKPLTNRTFHRIVVNDVKISNRWDAWREMIAYQPFTKTEVIESRVFSCLAWMDHTFAEGVDAYKFHFNGSEGEHCPVILNAGKMAVGYYDRDEVTPSEVKTSIDSVTITSLPHPLPPPDSALILQRIQDLQQDCQIFADNPEQYLIGPTGTWCLKDYPASDRHHPVFKDYVLQWEKFSASPKYASIAALIPRPAVFHNPPDVPLARVIAEFITGYALEMKRDALKKANSCDNINDRGGSTDTCVGSTSTSSSGSSSSGDALSANYNGISHTQNSTIVTLLDVGAGLGQYGAVFDADAIASASSHPSVRISWKGYDGAGNVDSFTGGRVQWIDVTDPRLDTIDFTADWIMSLELNQLQPIPLILNEFMFRSAQVAEHIPANATDNYLSLLDRHNKYGIILSWARRGQGGHGHVNERNNDEVISLLEVRGYYLDEWTNRFTDAGRRVAHHFWFRHTFLVFKKRKRQQDVV